MKNLGLGVVKSLIKKALLLAGVKVVKIPSKIKQYKSISLKTKQACKGQVLLSFRVEPFLDHSISEKHITAWMCTHFAESFLERGYSVDVIDYQDDSFIPKKDYDIFIDVHSNLERIGPLLNRGCLRILLIIWTHWLFHNYANYKRHLELQQRKNLVLKPKRQLQPTRSIELSDLVIFSGNQFTLDTYGVVQKPIFRLPIPSQITCPFPEDKDYETSRTNYLYFSGFGAIHKGLDLLLNAFAEMPNYHLYVCCRLEDEKDFADAYHKELFHTPNIHNLGFVDVTSQEFIEVANKCIGMVSPSCSEGGSGSVINGMHTGLIPIVSHTSGIDIDDSFGMILNNCSIEEIRNTVRMISDLPPQKLKVMSRNAWEFARKNHTREIYREEFRKVLDDILHYKETNGHLQLRD